MKLRNIERSLRLGSHSPFRLRLIVVYVSLQFADSWSACITQSQSNSPSSSNSVDAGSSNPQMKSFRGVVGSLTNFLLSPPKDAGHQKLQVPCSLLMTLIYFFVCFASFSCLAGDFTLEGHGCETSLVMRIKITMFRRSSQQTILQLCAQ